MLQVWFIALALGDLVTTLIGTRLAGADCEDHVLWRRLIARHGPAAFALAYLAVAAAALFIGGRLGEAALAGMVAVLALTVFNNLYVFVRILRR